jgi:hypothetical protein
MPFQVKDTVLTTGSAPVTHFRLSNGQCAADTLLPKGCVGVVQHVTVDGFVQVSFEKLGISLTYTGEQSEVYLTKSPYANGELVMLTSDSAHSPLKKGRIGLIASFEGDHMYVWDTAANPNETRRHYLDVSEVTKYDAALHRAVSKVPFVRA